LESSTRNLPQAEDSHTPREQRPAGILEWEEFAKVRDELPEYLKAPMTFAYYTGWRVRSEVVKMRWPQLDLKAGFARLEVGTTKNKKGRLIYVLPELRRMLENLRKANSIGLVFHNKGRPIANYYKAWHKACKERTSSEFPTIFAGLLSAT
jgi:integrase